MTDIKEFNLWKQDNLEDLKKEYRDYLQDTANDENFEIEHIEDFDLWCEVEFEALKERE